MRRFNLIILAILEISLLSFTESFCQNFNRDDNKYNFLQNIQLKDIPIVDSTNLYNFEYKRKLSKDQMYLMKLNKICAPNSLDHLTVSVNYRLNLSDNYKTYIISYSQVEYILVTVLANYDDSYNLIDFLSIAYDENFDNWSRTLTSISKENLKVTYKDSSTRQLVISSKTFSIDKTGKIIANH